MHDANTDYAAYAAQFGLTGAVTLPAILARRAADTPDAEALVIDNVRIDYRTLHERVQSAAARMLAAGVEHGEHVGILMGNSVDWVVLFYAAASIGAVTVPVNTRFKVDELNYCLKQGDVRVLFYVDTFLNIDYTQLLRDVEPAFDTTLPGDALPILRRAIMVGDSARTVPAGVERFDGLADTPELRTEAAARAQRVSPDDILLIQYTSGTTSFPKGVLLRHRNMLMNAAASALRIGVRGDDRYFSVRPFFHVAGTTLSLLVALVTGACLLSVPSFDVSNVLTILDEERCTLTSGNDTIFLMLMGHPEFARERIHLRGGWAAAGPEIMQKIYDVMGVKYMVGAYGQSEASPNVVLNDWRDPLEIRVAGWASPHPGIEIRTVSTESGEVQSTNTPGEIQVRGWSVMKGYYNKPEETANAFSEDGWLRTGDLGVIDADGRLRMLGRLKDVFRVGGENVAPAEVEETLFSHPAVQLAQVVGVPDARLGEVAAAFVVLRPGTDATSEELIAFCKGRCANFKVPRYLELVHSFDDIGMTGSSKVQKNKLRDYAIRQFGLA
ncbi:AMP-binding domain-containing protein [Caballeronia hypogeia]|uniref:AMP-binding domain-containing protein n=1 Tax=Caballeronia hypogeia TaxID=1777140 RepID=A0A158D0U0_9BURK|nr:AMP-binding protein [Caballeronia hypogeia]SAK87497.1 AMP-binding domain-containing protein [Caballeronia hypogeia]